MKAAMGSGIRLVSQQGAGGAMGGGVCVGWWDAKGIPPYGWVLLLDKSFLLLFFKKEDAWLRLFFGKSGLRSLLV
jgi:hypothetical protein